MKKTQKNHDKNQKNYVKNRKIMKKKKTKKLKYIPMVSSKFINIFHKFSNAFPTTFKT